uniref:Uncharacterized protein n=1 Tax=Mandrillus leucophaeus TaxID=9568 RepID=A0A2K5XJ18_MANLE
MSSLRVGMENSTRSCICHLGRQDQTGFLRCGSREALQPCWRALTRVPDSVPQ